MASLRGIAPQVDRLDRRRDPEPREPRQVERIDELDVLDPRPQGTLAGVGLEGVECRPQRRVADRVDLGHDSHACRLRGQLGQRRGRRREDPPLPTGAQRPLRLERERLEHRRGPRPQRAVGEQLLPADNGPAVRAGSQPGAAAVATFRRDRDRLGTERGVDPDRQAAGIGQAGVRRECTGQGRIRDEIARVVDGHHPERDELPGEVGDGRHELVRRRCGDAAGDEPRGRLVQDAGRDAVDTTPDLAAIGVRRTRPNPGQAQPVALAHSE